MYEFKKRIQDIILFLNDFICLIISYYISGYFWLVIYKHFSIDFMLTKLSAKILLLILAITLIEIFFNSNSTFFRRNKSQELKTIININAILSALIAVFDLFIGNHDNFSRGVYILTIVLNILLMTVTRKLVKMYLLRVRKHQLRTSQLFLITTKERVENVINLMHRKTVWSNKISSIAIIDENMIGETVANIPVVATYDTMLQYANCQVIDEIFINVPNTFEKSLKDIIMEFKNMGIAVHLNIEILEEFNDFKKSLNLMGDIPVVTFESNNSNCKMLQKYILKRTIDIIGSLIGIIITIIATIILAGFIWGDSGGPIFFKQKRVGKNGRTFYLYKFRSMYNNADKDKKLLMKQNEMKGFMFKLENDPRVTKVGQIIRKYSIDELPQFFNVFKGEMSLVGTRPPTVDEFIQYKPYHKRRLCTKPGMTGLWQVSGKNKINDFEDVVNLDLQYIDNWGLLLDFKILLKTIVVLFRFKDSHFPI